MSVTRIQVLSEQVANLIAAGEVVERPASVVKELVENALDAGARAVEVEIRDAGFSFIQVTDDGSGMAPEDARLAFARHATSKLARAEDLNTIRTLGFRGEALPSIASVARVELLTRPHDRPVGFRCLVAAGEFQEAGETGCAAGTRFTVRDLFFNTPARRKFMKSPATEQAHVVQALEWIALAHPEVRFLLRVDGRELINCPAADSLDERVAALSGRAAYRDWRPIATEGGGVQVTGLAGGPEHTRPTRQGLNLFVNRRPVEHRGITHAVLEAYRPLIAAGRYPTVYLFLDLPTELVDVNVHPAKREVRLRDEHGVHQLVLRAVRDALGGAAATLAPAFDAAGSAPRSDRGPSASARGPEPLQAAFRPTPGWSGERVRDSVAGYLRRNQAEDFAPYAAAPAPRPEAAAAPAGLRIIGQVGRTYIAAQDDEGFCLIDLHALHERLRYEQFKAAGDEIPRQGLLLPVTVELTPAQAALAPGVLDALRALGIELAAFGGNTFVIQTQPRLWEDGDLAQVVRDLLDRIAEADRPPSAADLREQALRLMACHGAAKAGDRLQPEAQQALVSRLGEIPAPWTCPHGRPFVVRMSWAELDRLFKRT